MTRLKLYRRKMATVLGVSTLLAAMVLLVSGFTSPAEAVPPGPGCSYVGYHSEVAGSHITAYSLFQCDGPDVPLPVKIEQFQSPGVWTTVASGIGTVTYSCNGTALNKYRTTSTSPFHIRCGWSDRGRGSALAVLPSPL